MTTKSQNKILIIDDSEALVRSLSKALESLSCEVTSVASGEECFESVVSDKPDLVFLDLMLPKMNGLEVLKKLKKDQETRDIGVIILTGKAMFQDYQMALSTGADYYLTKPFEADAVRDIVEDYFAGSLKPAPFAYADLTSGVDDAPYLPPKSERTTYAKFWGTRGSVCVCGMNYLRYGGNTVCLELRDGNDVIIIDSGTGIRQLGDELLGSDVENIHLIIGHSHWDHVMGFPFFAPVYKSKYNVDIYGPRGFERGVEELFSGMLDHDFFPVRLDEMQAKLRFHDVTISDTLEVGKYKVHFCYANHPGTTLCFKIEVNGRKVGYVTDNEFLLGYHGDPAKVDRDHWMLEPYQQMIEFCSDCDTLIHEAQYTPDDYKNKVGWGHSSLTNAAILVKHAGIREWVVTHHDPSHTDDYLLEKLEMHRNVLKHMGLTTRVFLAYDGLVLPF